MATSKKKAPAKSKSKSTDTQGTCACGAVQFTVQGELRPVVWCHCSKCQRFHGGPGAYTSAPRGVVAFQKREGLAWWDVSPTAQRGFCKACGSSLFFSDSNEPTLSICAGTLVNPPKTLKSALHIYVGNKPGWYDVKDGVKQLAGE